MILGIIFTIAIAFLMVVGVTVGFTITVIIAQRVLQRHLFRLQKRRLVLEYRVMDLASTTTTQYKHNRNHQGVATREEENNNNNNRSSIEITREEEMTTPIPSLESLEPIPVPPTATKLPESDASRLKRLGLM